MVELPKCLTHALALTEAENAKAIAAFDVERFNQDILRFTVHAFMIDISDTPFGPVVRDD